MVTFIVYIACLFLKGISQSVSKISTIYQIFLTHGLIIEPRIFRVKKNTGSMLDEHRDSKSDSSPNSCIYRFNI